MFGTADCVSSGDVIAPVGGGNAPGTRTEPQ